MNAGYSPFDSWIHEDGGRIVGEACHIIDLMNYFTESKIVSVSFDNLNPKNEKYLVSDNKSLILRYEDGSLCNIHYFALGNEKLSKEYMELHFDGKSIIMDNYQKLYYYGIDKKTYTTNNIEKGHFEELKILAQKLTKNELPIELWDLVQTSQITLNII
jgi:predicted dehydrogenase